MRTLPVFSLFMFYCFISVSTCYDDAVFERIQKNIVRITYCGCESSAQWDIWHNFSEIFFVNQKCEEGKVTKSDGRCGKVLIKDHSKRYIREFVISNLVKVLNGIKMV